MNTNGVIRKIDNLGRIVIPVEVRKIMSINCGDDLEISYNNDAITLKKYSYNVTHENQINRLISILPDIDAVILITDREKVVNDSIYKNNKLSTFFINLIRNSESYKSLVNEAYSLDEININGYFLILPIIIDSSCTGLVIIVTNHVITKELEMLGHILTALVENL